jgi:hypothetical protein
VYLFSYFVLSLIIGFCSGNTKALCFTAHLINTLCWLEFIFVLSSRTILYQITSFSSNQEKFRFYSNFVPLFKFNYNKILIQDSPSPFALPQLCKPSTNNLNKSVIIVSIYLQTPNQKLRNCCQRHQRTECSLILVD